jgi:putative FmdB family regulatory protein
MPRYQYHCENCDKDFEVIQRIVDPTIEKCILCSSKDIYRLIQPPMVLYKGQGFHNTDYK